MVATAPLLVSLKREHLGSVLFTDRVDQPFRDDLIGWRYSAPMAETMWDSHRFG